ncbi:hypothetical protein CABS01_16845 [Colletotrichum abscissum]|uniref:uncharacterized protein n=1 Tax=Colletotrichum abscissum TaxID=1671311 RepID=UPI0027D75F18|nr:uncharacterized protein CABS01_16845 [Colletotrichum abscissum]KAK1509306.1 hypothetical protein CABS01_16845 [Colletotrichum abscissum]
MPTPSFERQRPVTFSCFMWADDAGLFSTPGSDNLNPTLPESVTELGAPDAFSILRQHSQKWQGSPRKFFEDASACESQFNRGGTLGVMLRRIAFRIRVGEFFRCRCTWRHRELSTFSAHLTRLNPTMSSGHLDKSLRRWLRAGGTTDMILQTCAAGTIVASCMAIPDSRSALSLFKGEGCSLTIGRYEFAPREAENAKREQFLKNLHAPEIKQHANEFAALENALRDHIFDGYSCLRVDSRPVEPYQVLVFDSLAEDSPLQNASENSSVDGQPTSTDQQPLTCAMMQLNEHVGVRIPQQSPFQQSQQALSSFVHGPTTVHVYGETIAETPSHPAFEVQPWPSTNTIPAAPETIGPLLQQNLATHAVTSTPLPAHDICLAGDQHCSTGSLPTNQDRMQIHLAEQITASPHMAGYEQYQSQASLSTFGRPAHGPSHLRMDVHRQSVAEVPWECVENQNLQDSYRPHAMNPNTAMANLSWLRPQPQGPGFGTGSALSNVNESAMMNCTVAFAESETYYLHRQPGGNSQEVDVASTMCTTNMASLGDIRQRIQY